MVDAFLQERLQGLSLGAIALSLAPPKLLNLRSCWVSRFLPPSCQFCLASRHQGCKVQQNPQPVEKWIQQNRQSYLNFCIFKDRTMAVNYEKRMNTLIHIDEHSYLVKCNLGVQLHLELQLWWPTFKAEVFLVIF